MKKSIIILLLAMPLLASAQNLTTRINSDIRGKKFDPTKYADMFKATVDSLHLRQPMLVSGTNIKTVNGNSLLGSGNVLTNSGDVAGPASATDNAVARYDLTTGKLIQNSPVSIQDDGDIDVGTDASTNRSFAATGSALNIDITLIPKGSGVVHSSSLLIGGTTIGANGLTRNTAGDVSLFTSYGITSVYGGGSGETVVISTFDTSGSGTSASDIAIKSGSGIGTNDSAGSINIRTGSKTGSGSEGSINIQTRATGKLGFFNSTAVVKQSAVTNSQGIADALTAYGLIPSSTLVSTVDDVSEATTSLTLTNSHSGKVIYFTNSSAITVTLPSGLVDGFNVVLLQDNTGPITVTASGTTLNGNSTTTGQFGSLGIIQYKATNTYIGK